MSVLDEAMAEKNWDAERARSEASLNVLIGLAQSAQLFHTPDGAGFADLDINGHRETWPICSKGFRWVVDRRFFEETGGAASSEARQSALNLIEARAHFEGPERIVHVRVGGFRERHLSRSRR